MAKTTPEDFQTFVNCCVEFIKEFALNDWEISFCHESLKEKERKGEARISITGRQASVVLSTDWGPGPVTTKDLERTAFHEVCEIMLSPLAGAVALGLGISVSEGHVCLDLESQARHDLIHRLYNYHFFQRYPPDALVWNEETKEYQTFSLG